MRRTFACYDSRFTPLHVPVVGRGWSVVVSADLRQVCCEASTQICRACTNNGQADNGLSRVAESRAKAVIAEGERRHRATSAFLDVDTAEQMNASMCIELSHRERMVFSPGHVGRGRSAHVREGNVRSSSEFGGSAPLLGRSSAGGVFQHPCRGEVKPAGHRRPNAAA